MRTLSLHALLSWVALGCMTPPPPYEAEVPSTRATPGGTKTLIVRPPVIPAAERIAGDAIGDTDFGVGTSSWFAGGRSPTVEPTIAMVRDPETNLLLPQGWRRAVQKTRGTHTLVYHEGEERAGLSLVGLTLTRPQGPGTAQSLIKSMASRLDGAQVLRKLPGPRDILFIEMEGTRQGTPRKLGVLLRKTPERHAVAFFEAPTSRYASLGGPSLLFAFASGSAPTFVAPEAPAPPKEPQIADRDTQRALLATRAPVPKRALLGTWSQGMEIPRGDLTRQNLGPGTLATLGQGHLLTFQADGTYTWLHRYQHSYRSCSNEVESAERGSYTIAAGRVTLRPETFNATLCPCCASNPRPITRAPKERTLTLGLHPKGRHLAMRGSCPSHMIQCVLDSNDERVLWLGLTREL